MKVSNLTPQVRTVEVRVGAQPEDVVKIEYRPGALTLAITDQLRELEFDPYADLKVAHVMLLPIITKWDLQDEEGRELPATEETLKTLPIEFIGRVFQAIRDDAIPNPQTPATSKDGSQQEEERAGSLSGTGS